MSFSSKEKNFGLNEGNGVQVGQEAHVGPEVQLEVGLVSPRARVHQSPYWRSRLTRI